MTTKGDNRYQTAKKTKNNDIANGNQQGMIRIFSKNTRYKLTLLGLEVE